MIDDHSGSELRDEIARALDLPECAYWPNLVARSVMLDFVEDLPARIERALRIAVEAHAASMVGIPIIPAFIEQAIRAGIAALTEKDEP